MKCVNEWVKTPPKPPPPIETFDLMPAIISHVQVYGRTEMTSHTKGVGIQFSAVRLASPEFFWKPTRPAKSLELLK